AFQVDRSIYDKILLDHAESMGAHVFQGVDVRKVYTDGDSVRAISVSDPSLGDITAKWFVDASGGQSLFRKAFGVEVESPT
ncbi:FAD-dependent monooxygenase, partial [Acinetobacter baumannii]